MKAVSAALLAIFTLALIGCGGESGSESAGSAASDAGSSADLAANAPAEDIHPGKKIYDTYCFSCHNAGLSGAPKLGDVEGWAPRIAKGEALLLTSTIEGVGMAMPAKGTCFSCTDEELAQAVSYMVSVSQ